MNQGTTAMSLSKSLLESHSKTPFEILRDIREKKLSIGSIPFDYRKEESKQTVEERIKKGKESLWSRKLKDLLDRQLSIFNKQRLTSEDEVDSEELPQRFRFS